jgi:hypothetical protein
MVKIVILYLSIYNSNNGSLLNKYQMEMPSCISGNCDQMKACLHLGVLTGKKLVDQYKANFPGVVANVNCEWTSGKDT